MQDQNISYHLHPCQGTYAGYLTFALIWFGSRKRRNNFNHLINKLKLEFGISGISESRILKSQSLTTNVSLQNYVIKQTSTKSTPVGASLYINKRHFYKTCPDLASIFVEVVLLNKSNLIVGCIYKHLCMDISIFNDHSLDPF